ncbi:MAG: DNA-binding protein WhiA [Thermaerobacter sp.]|nr:DNA-binding protein WhiA [Thermaerobacter sp.]
MGWTYTREIKAELAAVDPGEPECVLQELRGIAGRADDALAPARLEGGSALVARRAFGLMKKADLSPAITVVRHVHRIRFVLTASRRPAPPAGAEACPAAFLRGAFLARGYLSDRDRPAHLEIIAGGSGQAEAIAAALTRLKIRSKTIPRRGHHLIYLKGRDAIRRFLTETGAHRAVLELESLGVMRSIKNRVNRLVNSETANLKRAVESGMAQAADLERWRAAGLLADLPERLRVVADLRICHPEWSLTELGLAATPPLSKSAVNHRLRRIRQRLERALDMRGRNS